MTASLCVDATDIVRWADRRDAQATLPQLVRRLVHVTVQRVHRAEFRAGEGVQLGGWDGVVFVEKGNAFVPDGLSVWELGTGKDPKRKANDEFDKRSQDPPGVDPTKATFVFVTARRWKEKDDWALDREKEGNWRDVRAYDADSLETWLEAAPAVHIWISNRLGKRPEGVKDAGSFWDDWSASTRPTTSPELVLAGRQTTLEAIHGWLDTPSSPLALRGESRSEALAVFAAAVQKLPPHKQVETVSRIVIVRDLASWNRLAIPGDSLILVQAFDSAGAMGRAMRHGHAVVLLLGHAEHGSANAVQIPRLSSEEAVKALVAMGVAQEKAGGAVASARRSLTSLRRRIALAPEVEQPNWAHPENARRLLPALLAGRWSDRNEGDRKAIAALASTDYGDALEVFARWLNEDDPPLRCVGSAWYLSSENDVWSLLRRYLTRDDLERFEQVVLKVLGTPDPSFDLPEDRRWMAGALGHKPPYSRLLHAGLANSLAFMGATGESIQITGGLSVSDCACECVRKLLHVNDWRVWASLPLPLLAEAAPDEFLSAADRGLSGDQPLLLELFTDRDDDPFGSSPHVGLLWALETLAWCKDHVARVALILAKLARLDPEGRLANRPLNSLRDVFLPWSPQTAASLERRLCILDSVREREPEVAWKLMHGLLPKGHDVQGPNAKPRWREWAPEEDVRVTGIEYAKVIHGLVGRMLEDVGIDGARWSDFVEALPQLPREDYDAVVTKLGSLDPGTMQQADSASLWNAIRTLISRHRSCPEADWSLPNQEASRLANVLARFEPREPLLRFGWLFGNRPALPEGREDDWEAHQQAVAARRCEAVKTLCERGGLTWVPAFVENVERPDELGAAFARSGVADQVEDDLFRDNLDPGDVRRRQFVGGLVQQRVRMAGLGWAKVKLDASGQGWSPSRRGAFCAYLPFSAGTWDIVESLGEDTVHQYWTTVSPSYVDEQEIARAVRRLLEHERPHVAVHLLTSPSGKPNAPATLVAESLEQLLRAPQDEVDPRRHSAHDVAELLEVIAASPDVEDGRVAALEWAFLPALGRHHYTPKLLHGEFARSPRFFAQVVGLVFRAEGEEPRELSEDDRARWRHAYELLQSWRWRPLPGMPEDGGIEPDAIRIWVTEAREILRADGRLAVGDHTIGQVLSGAPCGDDGAWPHTVIRDLIEELESDDFEQGIILGSLNSKGATWRAATEGGDRERKEAERYKQSARVVCDRWSRTGSMLRRMRDHYESRARDEDQRAELREDLSR